MNNNASKWDSIMKNKVSIIFYFCLFIVSCQNRELDFQRIISDNWFYAISLEDITYIKNNEFDKLNVFLTQQIKFEFDEKRSLFSISDGGPIRKNYTNISINKENHIFIITGKQLNPLDGSIIDKEVTIQISFNSNVGYYSIADKGKVLFYIDADKTFINTIFQSYYDKFIHKFQTIKDDTISIQQQKINIKNKQYDLKVYPVYSAINQQELNSYNLLYCKNGNEFLELTAEIINYELFITQDKSTFPTPAGYWRDTQ
jgi:hypothetical protein